MMTNRDKPRIRAFLNANPPMRGITLVDPHNKRYEMKNRPFIEVLVNHLPPGDYEVELTTKGFSDKLPLRVEKARRPHSLYFFSESFANLVQADVAIKVTGERMAWDWSQTLKTYTVSGRVLDRDQNPVKAYVWAARKRLADHEIVALADKEGRFRIRCPQGRELNLFIADTEYARNTMEAWVMSDAVDVDTHIDRIVIGSFEVYGLKAWYSASAWHIFFLPAKAGVKMPPDLVEDDVRFYVDGVRKAFQAFTRHLAGGDYPAYILSVDDEPRHDVLRHLKVVVDSPTKGYGEAHFLIGG